MSDKQSVIEETRAALRQFQASVDGLGADALTTPVVGEWSTRELAGHLIGWLEQMTTGLERMATGQRPSPEGVDWSDVEAWNSRFAAGVAGRDPAELLTELDSRVEGLVSAIQALPDDRFGEGKTVNRMVTAAALHHFPEHAEEIRQARAAGTL